MKYLYAMLILLLLTGCSSKSNFYQLHTIPVDGKKHSAKLKHIVIAIEEVDLPTYLDKPQVVTRFSQSRININENDRWVGDLDKNIQSVLAQDLSYLLPRYTFITAPWDEPIKEHYRIYLTVERLDGDLSGNVTFKGRWSLVNKKEERLITSEEINLNQKGEVGMDGLVETQSILLETLSRSIATKIRKYI